MSPHRKKSALFFSAIFLLCACALFFLVYRKINALNLATSQDELAWQTENNQREEIRWLNNSLKSIEGEQADLESHFAKNAEIVPFLDAIEGLGTSAGSKVEVTTIDTTKDKSALVLTLTAKGSFSAVYKTLVLLENSPYEIQFDSADFSSNNADTSATTAPAASEWTANFKIRVLTFIP